MTKPVSVQFRWVIRKEDAEMMGLWGGKAGDLSYYLKPGYTDASGNYAIAEPDIIRKSDIAPINPGCAHHQYLPTVRLELFSTRGIMLFYGNGMPLYGYANVAGKIMQKAKNIKITHNFFILNTLLGIRNSEFGIEEGKKARWQVSPCPLALFPPCLLLQIHPVRDLILNNPN